MPPKPVMRGSTAARVSDSDLKQLREHPVDFARIRELFAPHKGTITLVMVLIALSSLVSLAQPFLVRQIIDVALPDQLLGLLTWLALGLIGVAVVTAVMDVLQTYLSTRTGQRVMHQLRTSLFSHLQLQSLAFFTRTRGGEVHSRMTNDINGMQNLVTNSATSVASNVTTVVGTLVAMVLLSPWLSLISLVVLPLGVWVSRKVAVRRRKITHRQQQQQASLQSIIEQGLSVSGVRLSKTVDATSRTNEDFDRGSYQLAELEVQSRLAGRWMMAAVQMVFAAVPAVIYWAAGLPVGGEGLSIGTVVAFAALQTQLFRPVMGLLNLGVMWVTAMAFFSRVFEWLDLKPSIQEPEHPVELPQGQVRGAVSFENVSFSYDDDAGDGSRTGPKFALDGIDVHIPAGSSIAFVGHTGSGKSTLASLVPRLNDPTRGRVLIDGVDVRDMSFKDVANLVGIVSQETYLMHASVRENLLVAAPEATEEQLWEALESAHIAETVRGLPQGLDTEVGARGFRFSGGEQQRVAIARTLLRNPKILVLDEATSALDNTTEASVQRALDQLAEGRTTLTIAHRLSTVEKSDQIVVLEHGRIIEQGTASELRAAGGAFAALDDAAKHDRY